MTTKLILSSSLSTGITLTAGGAYGAPFTITGTGAVVDTNTAYALSSALAGVRLVNDGSVGGNYNAVVNLLGSSTTFSQGQAVHFTAGGTVSNLGRTAMLYGTDNGVYIAGGSAMVSNQGSIIGATGQGVVLYAGGSVSNSGSAALIEAKYKAVLISGGGGSIGNSGTILDTAGSGVMLQAGGSIANSGLILADGVAVTGENFYTTLRNTGSIISQGQNGVAFYGPGYVGNLAANALIAGKYYGVEMDGANALVVNDGTILSTYGAFAPGTAVYLRAGGTITDAGLISGPIAAVLFGSGTGNRLIIEPGAQFSGAVHGAHNASNTLEFTAGTAALDLGSSFSGFATLDFDTGAHWTLEADMAVLNGTSLAGFGAAQTLDVLDLSFAATAFISVGSTGMLSAVEGAQTLTLDLSPAQAGAFFGLRADASGGTLIEEVTCFAQGTRIATAQGEMPVEDLRIGDEVLTLHAGRQRIKWIGMRRYAAPFVNHPKVLPIHIRAGALADGVPARDLFVSPGHGLCVDGALVHAARLVNGVSITQMQEAEEVCYYHIELAGHEVIFAEACPAESFCGEAFRAQFQNAAEFHALYPGDAAPAVPCLKLLEQGFALAAVRRRLLARAGQSEAAPVAGPLRGFVDAAGPLICSGWAQDVAAPETPVCLDVLAGGQRVARLLANLYRADLQAAGLGSGCHGFSCALPPGLKGVEVRRAVDGASLRWSAAAAAA